jgi:hypothetical protein
MALIEKGGSVWENAVRINGMAYFPNKRRPANGYALALVRVRDNDYDPNAIAICWTSDRSTQIGWIPMSKTARLAPQLESHDGIFVVTGTGSEIYGKVVLTPKEPAAPVPAQEPPVPICSAPDMHYSSGSSPTGLYAHLGKVLRLRTSDSRVSVSALDEFGRDLAWFRKGEMNLKAQEDIDWSKVGLLVVEPGKNLIVRLGSCDTRQVDNTLFHPDEYGNHHPSRSESFAAPYENPTTTKESKMNFAQTATTFINTNKSAATQAGYMEAGRLANNQFAKLAGKHLPFMLRGYADTPVGKLVIANVAILAAQQLRPNDPTLAKLTNAMAVQAFQAVYQTVDIEGFLDNLLASPEIKAAMAKLPKDEEPAPPAAPAPRSY